MNPTQPETDTETMNTNTFLTTIERNTQFGYIVSWETTEGEYKEGLVPFGKNRNIKKGTKVRARIIRQDGEYHDMQFA